MNIIPLDAGTGLVEIFTSSLATIQSDVMSYVKVALPVALAILGVFVAVRLGVRFFKSTAK